MTSLILVRHARTGYNTEGRLQGSLDVPLGEDGLAQAERVARRVVGEYGTALAVVTSPLKRSVHTADAVAALIGSGPATRDDRFTQRPYGVWEGHTWDEVRARWPQEYRRRQEGLDPDIPGWGESGQVADRVAAGLREVAARAARTGVDTTVIVSHGSAIMLGVARLLGLPLTPSRLGHLPHGAWNELRWHGDDDWQLLRYCAGRSG
ncbi:MAG: histidine phosphatase family protein [Demequina sp.]|uniref:histidine phosphatase family protein n=1 Tax=Demequina sp. TaxID=2050685 RepID=UPI0019B564C7|nr:histidine phosphatase family protein [Demequina sp.]MBC7298223.1 histidine phosphatase family protein [Demequina sp.]